MIKLNLQIFATAGDLVNTLGGYASNATGVVTAFNESGDTLSPQLKTFYDTVLLDNVKTKDVFTQVAMKQRLPAQNGLTVEWRKWNDLADAGVLVEGIIPAGQTMGQTKITVSVVQYGLYVALSDRFMLHAIDDGVLGATERVGNSCVRTLQKIVRTALLAGTNTKFASTLTVSGGAISAAPTAREALTAGATTQNYLKTNDVALMQTLLITGNAETFDDGNFACIAHPHVLHDLMQSTGWQEAHKYTDSEKIYKGEVGLYAGIRFISSDLAPILQGANLTAAARTLKVNAAGVSNAKAITVKEAISTAEAAALAGRPLIISGVLLEIDTATAGAAGAAIVTMTENVTLLEDVVLYPGEGAAAGVAVYPTFFFGKDAFAAVEPEGANLRTIVKTPAQIGGALEQFGTVGAKFESAAVILYPTQLITLECTSSFSSAAVAN